MYGMRLYILNTTKPYSDDEGELVGDWFTPPVDYDEMAERIGLNTSERPCQCSASNCWKGCCHDPYIRIMIHPYDTVHPSEWEW